MDIFIAPDKKDYVFMYRELQVFYDTQAFAKHSKLKPVGKKISSADVNQCNCTEIIWRSVPLYLYSPFLQYLYSSVYLSNGQTLK